MRIGLVLALALVLAACDSGTEYVAPFDDPYANVYELSAADENSVEVLEGLVSLVYFPSDIATVPSTYAGYWELDASGSLAADETAPDGDGRLRGDALFETELQFFDDESFEEPLGFYLTFDAEEIPAGGTLQGQWELRGGFTGEAVQSGSFTLRLVREATQRYLAG